jgi:hypothetical protein
VVVPASPNLAELIKAMEAMVSNAPATNQPK